MIPFIEDELEQIIKQLAQLVFKKNVMDEVGTIVNIIKTSFINDKKIYVKILMLAQPLKHKLHAASKVKASVSDNAKLQNEEFTKVVCKFGVLTHFWFKKPYKNYRQYSQKFFNYTKSSCIIFYDRMFRCSHYTYCLQEESTHFCLEVSAQLFSTKNHTRKISKILKDF